MNEVKPTLQAIRFFEEIAVNEYSYNSKLSGKIINTIICRSKSNNSNELIQFFLKLKELGGIKDLSEKAYLNLEFGSVQGNLELSSSLLSGMSQTELDLAITYVSKL